MNKKDLSFFNFSIILFFSVFILFCFSCSDTSPSISSLHKTLIYEFDSMEDKATVRLSVFLSPTQDIRRSKSIEISHPRSKLTWKIDNPKIYTNENKTYFGYSDLVVPEDFTFPDGIYELKYFDVADRSATETFNISLLKSMTDTKDGFVKASDVISRKAGTECTQQKIILFDAIGKELFFGFYSSQLDSDKKILKLFPDAVTKRIYFCTPNNSVGILLPEEQINKE